MRAVIQRVREAHVSVDGTVIGRIRHGLVVLLGVASGDTPAEADALSRKIVGLRIFSDADGKLAHSVRDVGGGLLVVSQFTLYADLRKGRRPSFTAAAGPNAARSLYECFVNACRRHGVSVQTGRFQASMAVGLVNDGPVTLIVDSAELGHAARGRSVSGPAEAGSAARG